MPYEGRSREGVERDDVMNSSEYHMCMHEVYFTRSLLFLLWCLFILTRDQSMITYFAAGVMALNCFAYLYLSYRELNGANNG